MYYGGLFYMIFYALDYTIEKVLQQKQTDAQKFLRKFTDEKFSKSEAQFIFEKIGDHKWYVSERLQRDIGLNVAAVDYFENFYESKPTPKNAGKFYDSNLKVYENLSLTA